MSTQPIKLRFLGSRCGKSYKIVRDRMMGEWYDCFFFDWREDGWQKINNTYRESHRAAVEFCTEHAKENKWLKYLPTQ